MRPAPFTWTVDRHAGFLFRYRLFTRETVDGDTVETPFDLTGYGVRFMVREDHDEDSPILAVMDTATETISLAASDDDFPDVLDVITGGLPDTLTGLIDPGRQYGDIRLTPPDADAWYLFRGPFIVEDSVTTP